MSCGATRNEFETMMHEHWNVSVMTSLESLCPFNVCHHLYAAQSETGPNNIFAYFLHRSAPQKNVFIISAAKSDVGSALDSVMPTSCKC